MSTPGHKGGQSSHEIARNLEYVERLTKELVDKHRDKLVEMYRTMKRNEMAETLLPGVNINAARSALRDALKQLMDPDERRKIARQRWAESGRKALQSLTPQQRALAVANRVYVHTPENAQHIKDMIEGRGDALWIPDEEQLLVDMMKAGDDLQTIADAVSAVAQNPRTISACRDRWLITALISDEERKEVTKVRQIAAGRTFTDEERERGHKFDDADRAKAIEALGVTPWSLEEDAALAELRRSGKKFREIAAEISSRFSTERTTSGCIGRYYGKLKLGTRTRRGL